MYFLFKTDTYRLEFILSENHLEPFVCLARFFVSLFVRFFCFFFFLICSHAYSHGLA